jgi:Nuclease-related domain
MRIVRGPQPPRSARAEARAPTARRGEAGERVVRAALAAALDDHYVLVHDLYLPGGEGDVDAVLIGPRVLALEIATYAGGRPLRVRGLRWEYLAADERWVPLPNQPSVRAETGARRVAYALRSAGLPAYGVAAIVALVGGAACTLERPRVPVLRPAELVRFAREGPSVPQPAWPDLALRALLVAASADASR